MPPSTRKLAPGPCTGAGAIGLGAPRVYLVADVRNTGSQSVARRAGFTQEGVLRSYLPYRDGSRGDAALFSRLPGD
ncbi:GNAT family N-acetyltransferase [Modestobacter sp. SYSU DS0657]